MTYIVQNLISRVKLAYVIFTLPRMTLKIQNQPICIYKKRILVTLDLNVSSEITQRSRVFFIFLTICDIFFSSTNFPLRFSNSIRARFACAFICLSSAFAMNNSTLLKLLVKWLVIATKFLDCADNTWVSLSEMFSIGVLTSLKHEPLITLQEFCTPGDTGVKHSKSPLEAFGEQWSMMDCRLFNTFQAAWRSVHFNCSNTSSHWRVTLVELSSLLVSVLISFKVSLKRSFKVSSTKWESV